MRAEELMIGDWVINSKNNTNEKVVLLNYFFVDTDITDDIKPDDIYPIPITPEILEKNGFTERMYSSHFGEYVSEDRRITINTLSNSLEKDWYCHIDNEDMETIGGADVQYVHELQHLFNLCGIEKEVSL